MNIRTIRKKIKSINNVKKITRAMQMVSAIKMKKAQALAIESAPYRQHLENIIYKALSTVDKSYSDLLTSKTNSGKYLYIVITSNKGLCGSYNFNIFRTMIKNIDFSQHDFITLGKKGAIFINKMGGKIIADFSSEFSLNSVSSIFKSSLNGFLIGSYEKVFLIYNRFINTLKFETVFKQILPFKIKDLEEKREVNIIDEYTIEPNAEKIIDSILRSLVEETIRGAIIDANAAEHSSRMIAMKNATDNAADVIYNLTLLRNKIRQEKITYELLDMVTAKESVEGN